MPTVTTRKDYARLANDTSLVESCAAHVCIKVFTGEMKAKAIGCNDYGGFYVNRSHGTNQDVSRQFGIYPDKPKSVYSLGSTPRSLRLRLEGRTFAGDTHVIKIRVDGKDIGGSPVSCTHEFTFINDDAQSWRTPQSFPEWFCPAEITRVVWVSGSGYIEAWFDIGFGDSFQIPYRFTVIPVYLCNTQVNATTAANTVVTWNNYTEGIYSTISFSGDDYDATKDTSLILFY